MKKRSPKGAHKRLTLVKHLRTAKPYYCVSALKFGKRTWLTRDDKFSARPAAARRFPELQDATKRARNVLDSHPHLRSYKLAIHKGY